MRLVVTRLFRAGERAFTAAMELASTDLQYIREHDIEIEHLLDTGHVVNAHVPDTPRPSKPSASLLPQPTE